MHHRFTIAAALLATSMLSGCPGSSDSSRDVRADAVDTGDAPEPDAADTSLPDVADTTVPDVADTTEPDVDVAETTINPERDATEEPSEADKTLKQLAAASLIPLDVATEGSMVTFVHMKVPVRTPAQFDPVRESVEFLQIYRDVYGITDPIGDLYPRRIRLPPDPTPSAVGGQLARRIAHVVMAQRHRGIPVFGAEIGLHFSNDFLHFTAGRYLRTVPELPAPKIARAAAIAAALGAVPGTELRAIGKPSLAWFNLGLLRGVAPKPDDTHLAWLVGVAGYDVQGIGTTWLAVVDAHSGAPLLARDETDDAEPDKDFDIQSALNRPSTSCWDNIFDDDWEDWFDEEGSLDDYPGAGGDAFEDGRHAFDVAHQVYDFYYDQHERLGWDDDDLEVEIMVHAGDPNGENRSWYRNAQWSNGCEHMRAGDSYAKLDVIAHEWGHAIDSFEGNLAYEFQSGALDESFADVSAIRIDDSNFLIGEDIECPPRVVADEDEEVPCPPPASEHRTPLLPRDFEHPGIDHMDDFLDVPGEPTLDNDHGGVHANSGIPNRAAFLTLKGGEAHGFRIDGLGRAKFGTLYYALWTQGVWSSSAFIDVRNLAVAYTQWLVDWTSLGFDAHDVCDVKNAWAAVGVGVKHGDHDCDGEDDIDDPDNDDDWIPDSLDNCRNTSNFMQADADHDGAGDACDSDDDGDGLKDTNDACPLIVGNDAGDCTDSDHDNHIDNMDNCRDDYNIDQRDHDRDGIGDVCDDDDDGDGIADASDVCPLQVTTSQADGDGDGLGDECDNCPSTSNANQQDCDDDGVGGACDDRELTFGNSCTPPERNLVATSVEPLDLVPIEGCPRCGSWLSPDFEISVDVEIETGDAIRIVDERGNIVAHGQASTSQHVSFRPKPGFWYRPSQSDAAGTQVDRYFIALPGRAGAPAYDVTISVGNNLPGGAP